MTLRLLLAACALLALLAVPITAARVSVDAGLRSEVAAWIESEAADDGLAHMLLEAQASLQNANELEGDAEAEAEADADTDAESESESETDRIFSKMLNQARAAIGSKPVAAKGAAPVLQAKPAAPAPKAVAGKAAPAPAQQRPGLLGRMAARVQAAGQSVVAGVKKAGAAVKGQLQAVLAKNPKLAKLGAKIGEKLKSVSANIKAKLKQALQTAKSPAERQKAILNAKKAAKQAKKAAIKVAAKAAAKAQAAGKKVAGAAKAGAKKLGKAARKAARLARKAARKARRALRKNKPPRSSSKKRRDAQGRFVDRYQLPRHANGKLKHKKQLTKAERKAYGVHVKQSKLAHKALKKAKKHAKVAKADFKFEKAKLPKLRLAARKAARKAAKVVKKIDRLRQQAAMGGPKAQADLAHAQIEAAKLQKKAIDAQAAFRAQRNKVKGLRAALRARRKAVRDAKANIHENGFDQLLDKVQADVAKLDKSLFGGQASMKGFRLRRRSVEVPSAKYPGQWTREDMMIVERVPTRRVRILAEREVADPARPGFKVKKVVPTWRKVPRNLPRATRPVTILTKKEQRPFKGPDGKIIPVDVTYQVATQTVRAKATGGTPAGFTQQEVRPPVESGLIYKEVTKEFPALVNGAVRNLPFKVAQWSKASIVLKTRDGKQVPTLSIKEVKEGAAPISVQPLRSAPRQVDGKWVVSVIKQVPVKTRRGLMLRPQAIDIPATDSVVAGGAPKFKIAPKPYVAPKQKLKVVLEGVDNSIAAQQARKVALKAVEEDIQDNAINGSISERHLKMGERAHVEVDRVRENFFEHQDELALKQLIRPEHRFLD